jgi:hypothetical protein
MEKILDILFSRPDVAGISSIAASTVFPRLREELILSFLVVVSDVLSGMMGENARPRS